MKVVINGRPRKRTVKGEHNMSGVRGNVVTLKVRGNSEGGSKEKQ